MSVPQLEEPTSVGFVPLVAMSEDQRKEFESSPESTLTSWPEIGSRAFYRAVRQWSPSSERDHWLVVQPNIYRYWVAPDGSNVRLVLSEYLACEVTWH